MRIIHIAHLDHSRCDGVMTVLDHLPRRQRMLGHEVFIFNINTGGIPVDEYEYVITGYGSFRELAASLCPDLVVFHIVYDLRCYLYAHYLDRRHIPYLIQFHGGSTPIAQRKSKWKKIPVNYLFAYRFIRNARGGIFLNENERKLCVFPHLLRNSCIVPNGIGPADVKPRTRHEKEAPVKVLFLSRIDVLGKGLNVLIPAWLKARNLGLNAELHICGDLKGSYDKKEFERLLEHNDGSMKYHGQIGGSSKSEMLNNSDIFILPSRSEGMPMSVLEALSYGLPCVLTPQTNMTEYVLNGRCGWSTPLTEDDICRTLISAVSDYRCRSRELHDNALSVSKQFSWDIVAETSLSEYKRLL